MNTRKLIGIAAGLILATITLVGLTRPNENQMANVAIMSSSYTGAQNKQAILDIISTGHKDIIIPAGDFTIGNSTEPIIISSPGLTIRGTKNSKLIAATSSVDLLRIFADDVTVKNLTFQGPGGIDTASEWVNAEDRPALVKIGATGSTVIHRSTVRDCQFIDPAITSIGAFKAVGAIVDGNHCVSTQTYVVGVNTTLANVVLQTSAYCTVSNNYLSGMTQGVLAGGNATDTFDSGDGVTSGKNRQHVVIGNTINQVKDHAVYFSDDCENYSITGNVASSANSSIKFEGSGVSVTGNTLNSEAAGIIKGRNCSNVVIAGNYGATVAANATGTYGIFIGEATSNSGFQNITITGNTLVDNNGGLGAGILVLGQPGLTSAPGTNLNLIKKLTITGNTLVGWAGDSAGYAYNGVIEVQQEPLITGLGSPSEDVTITGNTIKMAANPSVSRSGIIIRGGSERWNVSNNTISGIYGSNGSGMVLHGASNGIAHGNVISPIAAPTLTAYGGVLEMPLGQFASDTLYVATSTNNFYADNQLTGTPSYRYWLKDKSSKIDEHRPLHSVDATADINMFPYGRYSDMFIDAIEPLNIIPSATTLLVPFEYGCVTNVTNLGSDTITFDPVGLNFDITASASARFIQIDTNTWVGGTL